jgi:hypothetical protein
MKRFLALLLLVVTGCTSTIRTAVIAADVPALNNASADYVQNGSTGVATRSIHTVRRTDGRLVQFKGKLDIEIHTKTGAVMYFQHPVLATINGDQLVLAASNRPATAFSLAELDHAVVVQEEQNRAANAMGGLALFTAVLVGTLVLL